jgi:hypothetical protein
MPGLYIDSDVWGFAASFGGLDRAPNVRSPRYIPSAGETNWEDPKAGPRYAAARAGAGARGVARYEARMVRLKEQAKRREQSRHKSERDGGRRYAAARAHGGERCRRVALCGVGM